MNQVRVHLGGEGANELGGYVGHAAYQRRATPGVVECLLRKVQSEGWSVVGATQWKDIRKYRAKGPTPKEERNVFGLIELAKRSHSQVVAFVRDADDDKGRTAVIESAVQRAQELFPEVEVIGGTAVPCLEGWVLALRGERRTDAFGKTAAQTKLENAGIPLKNTGAIIEVAEKASLEAVPKDATSLRQWLAMASDILPRLVRAAATGALAAPPSRS